MGNLVGYICPGIKRMCDVKISPTPTQWNSKCSKLFNLKADVGTTNKNVHNQMSEEIRFSSIVLDKTESEKEQRRELSPAHIKRGYSGPGHMRGVVVVSLCDAWGLPQFSNMLHWLKTMIEDLYALSCMTFCWNYVQYQNRSHLHMLYVQNIRVYKVLCTNNICVYKKIFYLIFQESFTFMLGFL